jgi:glycosyltransferase involved in cell wall biosynthesis
MNPPDISVVICTYNRASTLRQALRSVFAQNARDFFYQIIVVDNNSSDETPAIVESMKADTTVDLRYLREVRQGNAYARNTGVLEAEASIIAFLDDDCIAHESWLATMKSAFDRDPELAFVGGRVLPVWEVDPPAWLNAEHWSPLALLDYGGAERTIDGQMPPGLLTANLAVRRKVFEELGGFLPSLQRVRDGIGSMEDHELLLRICRSGRRGLYLPDLVTWARVGPERVTKAYHRRWHTGNGYFSAVLNDPQWERSRFQLGGVPGHLYKETAKHAIAWCSSLLRRDASAAFTSECRLRFFHGFFLQRRQRPGPADGPSTGQIGDSADSASIRPSSQLSPK